MSGISQGISRDLTFLMILVIFLGDLSDLSNLVVVTGVPL